MYALCFSCSQPYFKLCVAAVLILCGYIIIYILFGDSEDEGWKKLGDHYAADFVLRDEHTNLTTVNNPCTRIRELSLLIIVTSSVGNIEKRETIRETWATRTRNHKGNVSVLFLVGRSTSADLNDKVLDENAKYGDVIVENFLDTYHNLTVKSIMLLKWVKLNCKNAAFVMKMDDDVYLNVDNLMKVLETDYVHSKYFMMGKLYTGLKPDRRKSSKWYVPEHVYHRDTYPPFFCGVGFLMSGDVAVSLYRESFSLKLFFLEDVFITGMCADRVAGVRKNHIGFYFFEHPVTVECNSIHPHMILLSHYLNSRDMRKMHAQLMECSS